MITAFQIKQNKQIIQHIICNFHPKILGTHIYITDNFVFWKNISLTVWQLYIYILTNILSFWVYIKHELYITDIYIYIYIYNNKYPSFLDLYQMWIVNLYNLRLKLTLIYFKKSFLHHNNIIYISAQEVMIYSSRH